MQKLAYLMYDDLLNYLLKISKLFDLQTHSINNKWNSQSTRKLRRRLMII